MIEDVAAGNICLWLLTIQAHQVCGIDDLLAFDLNDDLSGSSVLYDINDY
jgi:hypothetical protein